MEKFNAVKKEIEKILPTSPIVGDSEHSKAVLKWLLKLKPNASEAFQIAALSHDIERAITGMTEKDLKDYSKIDEFKKQHSIRSAKIICEILKKHGYNEKIIKKVKKLVEKHESGGDKEANTLMDADSLAYFDSTIPHYLKRNGKERTKRKIQFMFKRLTKKGKNLVKKMKFKDKKIKDLVKEAIGELN